LVFSVDLQEQVIRDIRHDIFHPTRAFFHSVLRIRKTRRRARVRRSHIALCAQAGDRSARLSSDGSRPTEYRRPGSRRKAVAHVRGSRDAELERPRAQSREHDRAQHC
jgi:hypothetical protein